jgi:hypothetical protein
LRSARFTGNPVLEAIAQGDQASYLRFGAQSDAVRAVQEALIDLGHSIPDGATGFFGEQTSSAVITFKTENALVPNDPVVGIGTITTLDNFWALPFADRDEFLSGQTRPIPEFNFTRNDEQERRLTGAQFSFSPLSSWVPAAFQSAILTGLTALLDPAGSPDGAMTPSATWGASPLDLFHCHVVIDLANFLSTPGWSQPRAKAEAVHTRMLDMMRHADQAGPEGMPPWTALYRQLLLARGQAGQLSFTDQVADVLNTFLATSLAEGQTLRLIWHTFEHQLWRPVDVGSDSPRRAWWNDVAPVPSIVTATPFPVTPQAFGNNVADLFELGFLIDGNGVITVLGETVVEAAALVGLDKARINAAVDGLPFP